MKITGRDVKYFLLGVLTFFVIDTIMDWQHTKEIIKNSATDEINKIESEN